MNSNTKLARLAGLLYLCIIVFGLFAEMGVRTNLIVPGDAATTVQNIVASESLFRLGFMSDLAMMLSYLLIAYVFYVLFKSVDKHLASLIVLFVMAAVPIMFLNMLNQFAALVIVHGGDYLTVFAADQLDALVLLFLNLHTVGYIIPNVFFGLWLLPIGLLIYRSGYLPKILGILLVIACFAHLIYFVSAFLLPEHSAAISELTMAPTAIPEFALCLWLIVRGAKVPVQQSASSQQVAVAH